LIYVILIKLGKITQGAVDIKAQPRTLNFSEMNSTNTINEEEIKLVTACKRKAGKERLDSLISPTPSQPAKIPKLIPKLFFLDLDILKKNH